jgi:hypothetical protein
MKNWLLYDYIFIKHNFLNDLPKIFIYIWNFLKKIIDFFNSIL